MRWTPFAIAFNVGEENCGIGPDGFQPGNTCAAGGSGSKPFPKDSKEVTRSEGVSKSDAAYAQGKPPIEHIVSYNQDRVVHHATGSDVAAKIYKEGFKVGKELGSKRTSVRDAVYFADKGMVDNIYARTGEFEDYAGQKAATIPVNLKGLKLLNLNHKDADGQLDIAKEHWEHSTMGDLTHLPKGLDGYIGYSADGRIGEVVLSKDTANRLLKSTNNFGVRNTVINWHPLTNDWEPL